MIEFELCYSVHAKVFLLFREIKWGCYLLLNMAKLEFFFFFNYIYIYCVCVCVCYFLGENT